MGTKLDLKTMKLKFNLKEMEASELRELQDAIIDELKGRTNPCTAVVMKKYEITGWWIARIFITHVPDSATEEELKKLLSKAGYWIGDNGRMWENYHVVIGLKNTPNSIRFQFCEGKTEILSYDELFKKATIWETVN